MSDAPAQRIEEHTLNGTVENHKGKIIIHSKRKEKRKSRIERGSGKSSKTSSLSVPSLTKGESNSVSGRSKIARNARGIKIPVSIFFVLEIVFLNNHNFFN